jgi:nitroimidazol reductase NimA-like FMN-containing flavoprotein (pyridoxamine 5'-phosphate oxidase superfamily)
VREVIVIVRPADRAGLEILPFAECLRLLGTVPVGRVGFLSDGEVLILPVNHVADEQTVVFRSNHGAKLSSVGGKNLVGFEADDYDPRTRSGWSVVVSGFTEVVDDDGEIRRLQHLGLESWGGAGADASWIRIRPTSATGRRIIEAAFAG